MRKLLLILILFGNCAIGQTPMSKLLRKKISGAVDCPTNNTNRWKLNDGSGSTAIDICGGVNATTVNSPSWGADYLTLASASSQYVTTGNSTAFDGTSSFSVSIWVKSSTSDIAVIGNLNDEGGATYRGWFLYIYPNSGGSFNGVDLEMYGSGGSTSVVYGSNAAVLDGNWHNVIAVYTRAGSGGTATCATTLYIDGSAITQGGTGTSGSPSATQVGDVSSSGNLLFGTNPFYLSLSISYYNGDMSDIRMFNTAISSGTAASIFGAGRGGNY